MTVGVELRLDQKEEVETGCMSDVEVMTALSVASSEGMCWGWTDGLIPFSSTVTHHV